MPTDSLAAYKRVNLIRMSTATIGIAGQLRERTAINLTKLAVVFLGAAAIDNPLASIQTSRRHHVPIKGGKPVDNLSTRPRLRQTIARMTANPTGRNTHRQLATNSKTTAKTRAVKIATSSRIIASQVAETLIDSAENNRDCFSGWNLREPALRVPHTILDALGIQICTRGRPLLI